MAGRVLKVLEEQGLLTASGKTIVVFGARPKVKTRPTTVPTSETRNKGTSVPTSAPADDDDDDEDDDE